MIVFSKPVLDEICNRYAISVNGKQVDAITTRVSAMPFNRYWPGAQRPLEQTERTSYICFLSREIQKIFL